MCPIQNCPWDTGQGWRVYLIKEKTKNKLLKKIIGWLGRSQDFPHPPRRARARPPGSPADGRRTILEIGAALREEPAPAASSRPKARLAKFFAMLARDGFVRWGEGLNNAMRRDLAKK